MTKSTNIFLILLLSMLITGAAIANETHFDSTKVVNINADKIRQVSESTFSGGQPTKDEFIQLKENGIKTIINLRAPSEINWDQKSLMSELGLNYINLPIEDAGDITEENARELMSLIEQNNSKPLYVHCGSGNRVSALVAIAEKINDTDIDSSIEVGKK